MQKKIILFDQYDSFERAICDEPEKAIKMMNRAHYLNDMRRQYTAAARIFAEVEQLAGFQWIEPV